MKISVMHEVANNPKYCWDGDSGGWNTQCKYVKYRDRHGKRGTPIQRKIPKCTLFDAWLDSVIANGYKKCDACLKATSDAVKKMDGDAK